jgi:GT2 family glycosyltransferase
VTMKVLVVVLETGFGDANLCAARLGAGGLSDIRICNAQPAAINQAIAATTAEYVVLVPDFTEPDPDLAVTYARALDVHPDAALAYGDYRIHVKDGRVLTQTVLAHEADLSEWSSTGYVTAVRTATFREVGGYDTGLRHTAEYDLRLRLTRHYRLARVETPLYVVPGHHMDLLDPQVRTRLRRWFTPESSPRKGMGYLFQDPDERVEIDRVFEREVRGRRAWLDGPTEALPCPHGDTSAPTVSVVMPVHDRARFVALAIHSVQAGTYPDVEVLVVDGGSTDGTVDVVEAIAARDPRVRLIHNPVNQIARSLNLGVRAARGRYVAQLDSDDEYMPHTLERMVSELDSHPDWGLAISYYDFINADGTRLDEYGTIRHEEYTRNAILRTNGAGAVRVWHRCVLEQLGGFNENHFGDYAEDYDLVMRVGERWAIGRVHDVLYRCRIHGSNTEDRRSPQFRAERKSLARMFALQRRERPA